MARKLYPIGIQTFEEIRKLDNLYIDKTEYIYRMTHTDGKYFFLSRPRRFGKSLLVSTFQSYFEGKKELFKGLAIEKLGKEWNTYPVLHYDLSKGKHMEKEQLNRYLLDESGSMSIIERQALVGINETLTTIQKNVTDLGGTMRLGAYPCILKKDSKAYQLYGREQIFERHRHRYEVNNEYRDIYEAKGMELSGVSPDGHIVEMIELKDHPYYVATQAHPEFKSRPNHAHPLFAGLVKAAAEHASNHQ